MILADKIIALRKQNDWSQEDLASKLGVSRQAISKWESKQSTPDLERILAMSKLFAVSTDYLIKDDIEISNGDGQQEESGSLVRKVSMEEANAYLNFQLKFSKNIAVGVFLCIIAINPLLFSELWENSLIAEPLAFIIAALIVTLAVVLFMLNSFRAKEFAWLSHEKCELAYGVEGMLREAEKSYEPSFIFSVIVGVVLCIFTLICFVATEFIPALISIHENVLIALGFDIVAVAVFFFVKAGIMHSTYARLLKKGEFSNINNSFSKNKQSKKKQEQIMGIYWLFTFVIYLTYSFLTNNWGKSWLIWPIAGLVCGILNIFWDMSFNKE